jgi:hypothetical protein
MKANHAIKKEKIMFTDLIKKIAELFIRIVVVLIAVAVIEAAFSGLHYLAREVGQLLIKTMRRGNTVRASRA